MPDGIARGHRERDSVRLQDCIGGDSRCASESARLQWAGSLRGPAPRPLLPQHSEFRRMQGTRAKHRQEQP
eukprot:9515267-Alexandrium_andersonii.AAC.1